MNGHGRSRWRSAVAGVDVCHCGELLADCPYVPRWDEPTQVIPAPLLTPGQRFRAAESVRRKERECRDLS